MTFNQVVRGSNPRTLTVKKMAETLDITGFPLFLCSLTHVPVFHHFAPFLSIINHQKITKITKKSPIFDLVKVEIAIDIFRFLAVVNMGVSGQEDQLRMT